MRKLTFPLGGIHPVERKGPTRTKTSTNAIIPSRCIVPLQQHIGAPAEPLVEVGDEVGEGMLIGKASGFVSCNVHSPVPGTVKEIKSIFDPNNILNPGKILD